MNKSMKKYATAIKPHGLTVEHAKKHYIVRDNAGKLVATVSGTGETNALRQSVRDLWRAGLVPDDVKRIKF